VLHAAPRCVLSAGSALARLVLEADEGAQVARGAFISGHTSAFHTATASSSRSIAWRTGTWHDQPCRRISFQVPSTVYPKPFTLLLLGGRVPAALRIPHISVMCPQAADVTSRSLRTYSG
jgi:hypothetical protein